MFSRMQNCISRLKRERRERAEERENFQKGKTRNDMSNTLTKGKTVCCVWERKLKPFEVKMVKITEIRGSGISGGLSQIVLENGIMFRGSDARTRHLYQDKARLAGALEPPTRANVLIFTHGQEAEKHLREKNALGIADGIDFSDTEG